jgi:formamidopyrimidine-DNA glycosylase
MPELPEAQTIAAALQMGLAGGTIGQVRLCRRDFLKTGTPGRLAELAGRKVASVGRKGKYVIIETPPLRLVLQLGMSGRVYLVGAGEKPAPHTHLVLTLADGREMHYANARRIASGVHVLSPGQDGPLAALGEDALTISAQDFAEALSARRCAIKTAIMNQRLLAGVGNIYSDEALFRAGLRPGRRASTISRPKLLALHATLRAVLAEAIRAGGSTIKGSNPYASAGGELGEFTTAHRMYGRYGQPCLRCGQTCRRKTLGGRTSTFCPKCQK